MLLSVLSWCRRRARELVPAPLWFILRWILPKQRILLYPPFAITGQSCTILVQRKPFRCNTYGPPRMCCKQKTCAVLKSLRCNTYKKQGGGQGCYFAALCPKCPRNLRSKPVPLESRVSQLPILHGLCFYIHPALLAAGCQPSPERTQ